MCAAYVQEPINTWHRMKDELREKYIPPSFSACLMDKWHQYTQGNKLAKEYVTKFDKFLSRCNTFNTEWQAQILSRFRAGLRGDLRTELLARGVTKLKAVYALVQDLDSLRSIYNIRSFDSKSSAFRISFSSHFNKPSTQNPSNKNDIKGKSLEQDKKSKIPKFSKLVPQPNAINFKVMNI